MIVRETITHHVNLGDYEFIEVSDTVELTADDLPPGTTVPQALETARQQIIEHQKVVLERILNITANPDTYVKDYLKSLRSERRRRHA